MTGKIRVLPVSFNLLQYNPLVFPKVSCLIYKSSLTSLKMLLKIYSMYIPTRGHLAEKCGSLVADVNSHFVRKSIAVQTYG